ncbi:hypothetical protein PA171_04275 [Pseudomonas aeruginosa]|uniref:hypothetical protein n=1 Tax=Pseudomonas aeruginosa TaxID=287 RepID=UPI000DEEFA4C|nr:hypothetical protein [Pseudomonas aeruginosa]RCM35111.1 hypothetical protein PA171_04275 [Pseudomonas aeruginosa]
MSKELNKAPVEQAGGDERAAFFKHLIGRHPAHETEIVRVVEHNHAAWKAWQARAALAQPSPAPELERPEVVGYCVPAHIDRMKADQISGFMVHDEQGEYISEPLIRLSQHDRIVGALTRDHAQVEDHLSQQIDTLRITLGAKRESLDAAQARVAELEANAAVSLPPFAEKVLSKLRRFYDCAEDFESGGVDIGRHWLDLLTQLGLLNRVQRSPALWEISQQGEDLLEAPVAQAGHVPDVLFDGFAVYLALSDKAKGRTSIHNVSDTLDAVVKLIRAAAPAQGE